MDLNAIKAAFENYGDKIKAFWVVHLYALSADLDKIIAICDKYNVPVIEDTAKSLGA